MKIVTWNCNGALRNKTNSLDKLKADLLIVQECENPELSTARYREWAGNYIWEGENKNKGIGIFSRNGHRCERLAWLKTNQEDIDHPAHRWDTNDLRQMIPFMVNEKFTAVAVWTKQAKSPNFRYIGQLWKFLKLHLEDLTKANTFLCGDLNSNVVWDEPDKWWNHTDVVNMLKSVGITSLYHETSKETPGNETVPTFFMHRNLEKPYHIDYFFVSKNLVGKSNMEIGNAEEWLKVSDHVPLTVTLDA